MGFGQEKGEESQKFINFGEKSFPLQQHLSVQFESFVGYNKWSYKYMKKDTLN